MKFIQQAYKGENEWWTYMTVIILFFIGWQIIGVIPLVGVAYYIAPTMSEFIASAQYNFGTLGIDSNFYLLLIIFTFFGGLIFLFLGVKYIHKRAIITVITSREKIDWSRVFYSFLVWTIIGILTIVIDYIISPENYVWNFKPISFFILLIVSFVFLPIQTSMEEILFRGYLMQGFGTWFKKSSIALLLTAVIFGSLHFLNPEVAKLGWFSMIFYIGTGLLLGIIALMDEGIELTLGFHAANNIVAAVLVTTNWTVFRTDALLIDRSEPTLGATMFLPVFVFYPLLLILFASKYKWTNWREKLTGTVMKPIEFDESKFIA